MAPTGAQEMLICVRPSGPNFSRAYRMSSGWLQDGPESEHLEKIKQEFRQHSEGTKRESNQTWSYRRNLRYFVLLKKKSCNAYINMLRHDETSGTWWPVSVIMINIYIFTHQLIISHMADCLQIMSAASQNNLWNSVKMFVTWTPSLS